MTIDSILANQTTLILGSAGAGKTSLAAYIATRQAARGRNVVFVRLGSWRPADTLVEFLTHVMSSHHHDIRELGKTADLLILDAVDESRLPTLTDAFDQVTELLHRASFPTVVVTCRTGGVPSWIIEEFDEVVEVLPLEPDIVRSAIGSMLPDYVTAKQLAERDVIELCRNPMMLAVTAIIGSSEVGRTRLQRVRSRSQLVMLYIDLAIDRDARRFEGGRVRSLTTGLAKYLLVRLAVRLSSSAATSITDADLELACSDWLGSSSLRAFFAHGNVPTASELSSAVKTLPLLVISSAEMMPSESQFSHLNIRDVLAASAELGEQRSRPKLPLGSHQWPQVVIRAGLEVNPGVVSSYVIDYATSSRDQEYFRLGAQCVLERWDEQGKSVDDLVLRVLDAFKNWGKPFDYELVRVARALSTRLSSACPKRLSDDLNYFGEKYAPFQLDLVQTDTPRRVYEYLSATDEQLRLDALYSVPIYVARAEMDPSEAGEKLWEIARTASEPRELEVTIASLKSIAERAPEVLGVIVPELVKQLVRISAVSWRATAFALNTLAYIGDRRATEVIGGYLLHPENKYRDSASWSLLILARRFKDDDIRASARSIYRSALVGRDNITNDGYAIGNVLYAIGDLGLTSLSDLVQFFCGSKSAYVREDAVFSLGLLGENSTAPLVSQSMDDLDPGVRLKAVEAAGRIRSDDLLSRLRNVSFSASELPYIKLMAGSSVAAYSSRAAIPDVRNLLSRRRKRDSQTCILGPFTIAEAESVRVALVWIVSKGQHERLYAEKEIDGRIEFAASNVLLSDLDRRSNLRYVELGGIRDD